MAVAGGDNAGTTLEGTHWSAANTRYRRRAGGAMHNYRLYLLTREATVIRWRAVNCDNGPADGLRE